ncbi:gliding motility-associated protein GldE [Galbibacter sp. EGI 63066]|uniref:gliding motility-associated protein GldE n=1 Tax=Galbibacter sp. EGI 63066 TaxID=2993559 RepID=UPI0022493DBA|nr:gliding motility-associated protein GldE [Galbibacter sp. EGI 63066]MCX2681818.1 gliding motility-associated protein GldE [Galbibacter sp. EGI 63066]
MDPEPSSLFLIPLFIETTSVIKLGVLGALFICSALISGAEVAFFSLSQTDVNEIEEAKTPVGNIIVNLLNKPKKLLATILVANNFINIAIVLLFSSLGTLFFGSLKGEIFGIIEIRFIVEVIVATFLILLFGEILPKIYASRNRMKFAHFMAYPLSVLDTIFYPLSMPMRSITLFLHNKLGKQKANISVDQLSHALELTSEEDTTVEEQKILQGIVSFGNTDTRQVMRPRIDIFALSEEMKYQAVVKEIVKNGYSRIPVYKDNMDNVTGVLYVKDLLPYLDRKTLDWVSLKRSAYFVPENKKLDDLLKEFQEMKNHLAIVVDEYGGTSGLVALEDIIEEIVGDISDEFDDEDLVYSKLDEKNYVFEGKTALKDFYRVIDLEDETPFEEKKGESETIAGFVLEVARVFPKKGEEIIFNNIAFVVEALDKKRIKQIKITLL